MFKFRKKDSPGETKEATPSTTAPTRRFTMDDYGTEEWYTRNRFLLSVVDVKAQRQLRVTTNCLKGGVTKTTVVLGVGTAMAMLRRDLMTIIDANPHRGTGAERLGEEHSKTVRDMLDHAASIHSATDYAAYVSQAKSRLEIVASDKDPTRQQLFSGEDYSTALEVITAFRSIVLTDTGIDLLLPMMQEVYASTDVLIVPATTAADGYRLAAETLDFWEHHAPNGPELVRNAIVPLTVIQPFTLTPEDMAQMSGHGFEDKMRARMKEHEQQQRKLTDNLIQRLSPRVSAVVPVPYDPALATGYKFDWNRLMPETQEAYIELAYQIALHFPENARWRGIPRADAERQYLAEAAQQPQAYTPWDTQHQPVQQAPVQQPQWQQQPMQQQWQPEPQPQWQQQPMQAPQQPQQPQQWQQAPQPGAQPEQAPQPVQQWQQAPQPEQAPQPQPQPVQQFDASQFETSQFNTAPDQGTPQPPPPPPAQQ